MKNRVLDDQLDIFKYNAWDNSLWTEDQIKDALHKIHLNASSKLDPKMSDVYIRDAPLYWDKFYEIHDRNFFKDRSWLLSEFPEIQSKSANNLFPLYRYFYEKPSLLQLKITDDYVKIAHNVWEIGCGVGNTMFPLLSNLKANNYYLFGSDFSSTAIKILQSNPNYDSEKAYAFVSDITTCNERDLPFPIESIDVIILIFVLSALKPEKLKNVIDTIFRYLKPHGYVLIRDYGRYDLAQLRFKTGQCLDDNFYVRKDGTCVYFFTQEDMKELFLNDGYNQTGYRFEEKQNILDKRIIVNRKKKLVMHRVWLQCKYQKVPSIEKNNNST